MTEYQWDKKLNIKTTGRDASNSDGFNNPYEPTPYSVLDRLFKNGYITDKNVVCDYGCGKGRVSFFLSRFVGCRTIGIEHDQNLWQQAMENKQNFCCHDEVQFLCQKAEDFNCISADCFYFFNPFSIEVFKSVMKNIMTSYYQSPRPIKLFFYYPDDEYLSYLLAGNIDELYFLDEIDCRDLFDKDDSSERIMIFEL